MRGPNTSRKCERNSRFNCGLTQITRRRKTVIYEGVNDVVIGAAMEILEARLRREQVVRRGEPGKRNAPDLHFQLVSSVSSA